jgi:hypothetical protein
MALLGCEAQVEAHFSPFRDTVHLDARWLHGLRRTYHWPEISLDAPDATPR